MAQHQQPDHSGAAITSLKVQPYQSAEIVLTSPAIDADGWLSIDHAQAGDGPVPAVEPDGRLADVLGNGVGPAPVLTPTSIFPRQGPRL